MPTLPLIITRSNKARVGLITLAVLIGTYSVTNAIRLRPLTELHPGPIDALLPLVPPTVWIYMSYPLLFISAYAIEEDPVQLNRFFYADVGANILSQIIFLAWPTTFLRPSLPDGGLTVSEVALQLYWRIDDPVNCFPSLHVSTSVLPTLLLWKNHRRLFWAYLAWCSGILLSTMTTKQHHSIDVIGGVLVAVVMYWLFFVRATYEGVTDAGGASQGP